MNKSTFIVSKMDCPSEENLIKLRLQGIHGIKQIDFDIPERIVDVYHEGTVDQIHNALQSLDLDTSLLETGITAQTPLPAEGDEKKLLWAVLLINFTFFILELSAGFIAHSMGLVADSLDMLADALVYGLSLYAVNKMASTKNKVARFSGYLQMLLALSGFFEVLRRFFGFGTLPEVQTMIVVSLFALCGNVLCLYLLQRSKNREAHMQASLIFTSNDVLVNIGVIAAGGLVYLTGSRYPDLVIGCCVFLLVARGAMRILKLSS